MAEKIADFVRQARGTVGQCGSVDEFSIGTEKPSVISSAQPREGNRMELEAAPKNIAPELPFVATVPPAIFFLECGHRSSDIV